MTVHCIYDLKNHEMKIAPLFHSNKNSISTAINKQMLSKARCQSLIQNQKDCSKTKYIHASSLQIKPKK